MRLDLYQLETARIAAEQGALLDQARAVMQQGQALRPLEDAGVLHALQVLIENAIGKAKQLLKAGGQPVPVSAHDAFAALATHQLIDAADVPAWHAVVGLRNRIVHDYMNIDMVQVRAWVQAGKDHFVTRFLLEPFSIPDKT
ncbi:MAG: DUF86 domain-containing protein [Hydrogenophaga sp.]|uniref:type VII toxin-antitoxin system HepT family RNase toxin n=1 Tax=Hydrogenophaga sp. TaxID=1904254 RepID=UPI002730380E|nr:DUF86 domain-containing protein [Hydrogenophaga sp.]MDP2163542.1 DUF86 domain-containing protein [Hydrogenophaga sp.]MDP3474837.1 DUF86 domain-containing protein [Hydrogenophaga sp.]